MYGAPKWTKLDKNIKQIKQLGLSLLYSKIYLLANYSFPNFQNFYPLFFFYSHSMERQNHCPFPVLQLVSCPPPTRLINHVRKLQDWFLSTRVRKMTIKPIILAVFLCILLQGIILHVVVVMWRIKLYALWSVVIFFYSLNYHNLWCKLFVNVPGNFVIRLWFVAVPWNRCF